MAAGFTTIQYGVVYFYRCTTRSIEQTPQYDSSGTDIVFMRTKVAISGFIDGNWYPNSPYFSGDFTSNAPRSRYPLAWGETEFNEIGVQIAPNDPNGNASIRHFDIRRKLYPRQVFTMRVADFTPQDGSIPAKFGDGSSGNVLLTCSPAYINPVDPNIPSMSPGGIPGPYSSSSFNTYGQSGVNLSNVDLNNGPRCTSFRVTGVTSDNLYMVDVEFEICMLECDINGDVPYNSWGVLSNKWSCQDYLNSDLRTTRTYSGVLRLASQINAQQLRWLCLPPLVRMFRRDHFEFIVSEDGLTLKWMVVDQEVSDSPPYPAKTWQVTSSTAAMNGMKCRQSVDVNLTADVNTNRRDLLELALYIMCVKIYGQAPTAINRANVMLNGAPAAVNNNNQYVVEQLEFTDYIGDELHVSGRMVATAPMVGAMQPAVDVEGEIAGAWTVYGKNFVKQFNATNLTNSGIAYHERPDYDRTYSYGAYPLDAPAEETEAAGGNWYGDQTPYGSPAASITQIFLNYLQYPCYDTHATYNGPNTPGPGGKGPLYNRNLDPLDRNQSPYVNVSSPDNTDTDGEGSPQDPPLVSPGEQANPPTYNTTMVPTNSPALDDNPYVSDGHAINIYTHWSIQNLYKTKTMRMMCPIAFVPFPDDPYIGPALQPGSASSLYPQPMFNLLRTTASVQVSANQTIRIIRLEGERVGADPEFPDISTWFASFVQSYAPPQPYDPNLGTPSQYGPDISNIAALAGTPQDGMIKQWPIKMKVKPSTVTTTVTGQLLYSAVAEYHIGLSRSPNPGEKLDLGNNMWDNIGKQASDVSGNLTAANWNLPGDRTMNFETT